MATLAEFQYHLDMLGAAAYWEHTLKDAAHPDWPQAQKTMETCRERAVAAGASDEQIKDAVTYHISGIKPLRAGMMFETFRDEVDRDPVSR